MNAWTPIDDRPTVWNGLAKVSDIVLENGTGFILREDGGKVILEVQPSDQIWEPFPRYVALTSDDGRLLTNDHGDILIVRDYLTIWTVAGD